MKSGLTTLMGAIVAVLTAAPGLALACSMCGLPPGDNAGHAYNTSVLFMLFVPYFTVIAIGGIVVAVWKRAQHRERVRPLAAATRR